MGNATFDKFSPLIPMISHNVVINLIFLRKGLMQIKQYLVIYWRIEYKIWPDFSSKIHWILSRLSFSFQRDWDMRNCNQFNNYIIIHIIRNLYFILNFKVPQTNPISSLEYVIYELRIKIFLTGRFLARLCYINQWSVF